MCEPSIAERRFEGFFLPKSGGIMTEQISVVLDETGVQRALVRMTHEILERNKGVENLVIVGIKTRGEFLAKRLAATIEKLEGKKIPIGAIDITMHRDDLSKRSEMPKVQKTEIPFEIEDKTLVLVDDVLFSGRSTRAALDELTDFGRPAQIMLAVLVDRGHRELPIRADFVGKNIPTRKNESIRVHVKEVDQEDAILLVKK